MKIIILAIFALMALSNCEFMSNSGNSGSEFQQFGIVPDKNIPDGPPEFREGYKAGCARVHESRGNGFYRSMNDGMIMDPVRYVKEPLYKWGVDQGVRSCFNKTTVNGYLNGGAWDNNVNPAGTTADIFAAGSWNMSSPGQVFGGMGELFGMDMYKGSHGGGAVDRGNLWGLNGGTLNKKVLWSNGNGNSIFSHW